MNQPFADAAIEHAHVWVESMQAATDPGVRLAIASKLEALFVRFDRPEIAHALAPSVAEREKLADVVAHLGARDDTAELALIEARVLKNASAADDATFERIEALAARSGRILERHPTAEIAELIASIDDAD